MSEQSLFAQKQIVVDVCRKKFGEPQWIVATAGRVNLIGEHLDYNDGFVLPIAINRYTMIAATTADHRSGKQADLYSMTLESRRTLSLEQPLEPIPRDWTNYVAGVIAGFQSLGFEIPSFAAVIHSTVPPGSGLSSSAALEVATATMLESMLGVVLDPLQKAQLCQNAEHKFARVPCGVMDQLASVFGLADHAMLIDCRSLSLRQVPFMLSNAAILIVNSGVKHELANSEYKIRQQQCQTALEIFGKQSFRQVTQQDLESSTLEPESVLYRRSRHVVLETARTVAAANRLENNDLAGVGDLMSASHQSMKDDYEISCEEIDELVRITHRIGSDGGVYGSRMTGGGFGGCTVSLIDSNRLDKIRQIIGKQYKAAFDIIPEMFVVRPSRGAHSLDLL